MEFVDETSDLSIGTQCRSMHPIALTMIHSFGSFLDGLDPLLDSCKMFIVACSPFDDPTRSVVCRHEGSNPRVHSHCVWCLVRDLVFVMDTTRVALVCWYNEEELP